MYTKGGGYLLLLNNAIWLFCALPFPKQFSTLKVILLIAAASGIGWKDRNRYQLKQLNMDSYTQKYNDNINFVQQDHIMQKPIWHTVMADTIS